MSTKNSTIELESLRLPELQARFREVVGEISKSPNRKFLMRRIEETLAAQARTESETQEVADAPVENTVTVVEGAPATETESAQPAEAAHKPETSEPAADAELPPGYELPEEPSASDKPARGRFSGMTVPQLQAMYLEVVGRSTGSDNKAYLIWKIREAEKGRITVGPVQARKAEGAESDADVKVLPLRLETQAVEAMDAAWRKLGMKTRMDFLRRALGHYLKHLGATDAAAHFATPE